MHGIKIAKRTRRPWQKMASGLLNRDRSAEVKPVAHQLTRSVQQFTRTKRRETFL